MHRPPSLQELPASLGRLQRLKLLQLDSNQISGLPPTVLRDCSALVGGWWGRLSAAAAATEAAVLCCACFASSMIKRKQRGQTQCAYLGQRHASQTV